MRLPNSLSTNCLHRSGVWGRIFDVSLSRIFVTLTLLAVLALSFAVNANEVNIGRVNVDDQSFSTQKSAGKQALAQVFVKVSGNRDVVNNPTVKRAINNFEQYLLASRFKQQSLSDDGTNFVFEASFNLEKVQQLLVNAEQPVWPKLRPAASLWVTYEQEPDGQSLLNQHSAPQLLPLVYENAFERGVDIVVPIGDLEDEIAVSISDVSDKFIHRVSQHSERYNSEYVILASIEPFIAELHDGDNDFDDNIVLDSELQNKLNEAKLRMLLNAQGDSRGISQEKAPTSIKTIESTQEIPSDTAYVTDFVIASTTLTTHTRMTIGRLYSNSQNDAITSLINVYADELAAQFSLAPTKGGARSDVIAVENVVSLNDYITLIEMLRSIPGVDDANLTKQESNTAYIDVSYSIEKEQLTTIITLDPRLTQQQKMFGANETNASWFKWQ